ncbi:MAG: bifunctional shikimate kinase/3-dehydroquinate synthase, partial [Chloroflexota bacterium]|nr:bifunctional shikimate kinase/3-dehydroquinate synthase [Chloroflexota bacterium]
MGERSVGNLFLVGFSMTGKTRVGQQVARRLGWGFVDTDEQVAARAGKPVPRIFAEDGEPRFRELERQVLLELCQGSGQVVSTGGGAVLDPANREAMAQAGVVVLLEASPETIYRRLQAAQGTEVARPLLEGADPLARIEALKEYRQPFYASAADWTVHTDNLSPSEVTYEVVRGWRFGSRRFRSVSKLASPSTRLGGVLSLSKDGVLSPSKGKEAEAPYCQTQGAACVVTTSSGSYPVFVGWGLLDELGRRMRNAGLSGMACLISDETVFSHYGPKVEAILREAGFGVASHTVKPGEASKSLDSAARLYDWMVERRIERGHPVVALGGGVVGDLAGFVAATFLRGLPLVQVPTSLLAMVDASIGGKVAVDHPQGKNLIGAFYQPRLVLADVQTLTTLPPRELRSGWAEVVKHGLILDSAYFSWLEASLPKLARLEGDVTAEAV